jgi:hypothetical protein
LEKFRNFADDTFLLNTAQYDISDPFKSHIRLDPRTLEPRAAYTTKPGRIPYADFFAGHEAYEVIGGKGKKTQDARVAHAKTYDDAILQKKEMHKALRRGKLQNAYNH